MSYPTDTMHSIGSAWQVIAGVELMTYTMGCFMAIVKYVVTVYSFIIF